MSKLSLKIGCAIIFSLITANVLPAADMQAFNSDLHRDIKTIGLVQPRHLGEFRLSAYVPGLFGALSMIPKEKQFHDLTWEFYPKFIEEYQNLLISELGKSGYQVKKVALLSSSNEKYVYNKSDIHIDAFLEQSLYAGYWASAGNEHAPFIVCRVRLVKKGTDEILYQDTITYGSVSPFGGAGIAADQKFHFSNHDALINNYRLAIEGMRNGIPLVCNRIVVDLGR